LLSVAFAALLWLSHASYQAEQLRAVTVYSRNSTSLSLFRDWKEVAHGQAVAINQEAFLFPERLSGFDGVMIASPRRLITAKEARVLATYVRQGGRLLVSAHDQGTYANLHDLLQALDIRDAVAEYPGFKNKQIIAVSPPDRTEVFDPGKQYGFYSLIRFATPHCQEQALECFARERTIERGKVLLTLGLPLPGNAMLSQAHNLDFTVALGHWAPRLLIDEYHHFFTQQTWTDLLLRADVAVPLGGMIAGLVLFFLFGHSRVHERVLHAPLSRPYHALNENIVRKFLLDPALAGEALDMQRQFLLRLFPEHGEAVNTLCQHAQQRVSRRPGALARALGDVTRLHRELLIRRGRRRNA
jgi:hypothetical protein